MIIYAVYLSARLYGFHYHDPEALRLGADWLAIGEAYLSLSIALLMRSRRGSHLPSSGVRHIGEQLDGPKHSIDADGVLLLVYPVSDIGCLADTLVLMGVAVFCFLGFAYALFTLANGRFELSQIGWWLLEVYFGLDASGFESARECLTSCVARAKRSRRLSSFPWTTAYGLLRLAVQYAAFDSTGSYTW